ncbi:hypothetical protein C7212DRAFT_283300 [Tuber magnatum]|uniref:Uncharacterized protein n=1 Tax=Tuber magnatum TaxID=42249 RepID=A0A317SJW7_9PEZI|nr:hypothetical protein C7212DRAFT_283300 [Tuber magnatum]
MSSSGNEENILQCLYTSSYGEHWGRVRDPVEGTCTWVTEHPRYKNWLEEKSAALLWLSADPGCGKSVTASFLIKHLKTRADTIVCYFFFKDDYADQRSPKFALCAILHQLFTQRKHLCGYAEQEFKAKGKGFTEEVGALWDILVKAVADKGCGDVICVVDALDECEEGALAPLIRHITGLPKSQTPDIPLKFLVTSRPYHRIEIELVPTETTIRLKGEDEVTAVTTDVNRVIDEGVENLESYWGQPGELGYLRKRLQLSADRTFLWVSLILEILRNTVNASRAELMNIVSTTPANLDKLYTKILSKSTDYDKARRVLNIVVAAARPLTLDEMNIAFAVRREHKSICDMQSNLSPDFEKTVKNVCGLFVRVIDLKIYLVHQTAREFLIKRSSAGQTNPQYTLCPKESNFLMADICISYLSLEEFEKDALGIDTDRYERYVKGELHEYDEEYPFLHYAAIHWADHFQDSQNQGMELFEATRLICRAGSGRVQAWFPLCWGNWEGYSESYEGLTHLMIASWLGQGMVVERLLEEGGDINAQWSIYGTALNLAAIRKHEDVVRILMGGNVNAHLFGRGYNILQTVCAIAVIRGS